MASNEQFMGTANWLRGQWSNPSDVFTILLIIGGDIVQSAIAQLCVGPVSFFTPAVFSFGWVSYAISAMCSAVGANRLMPRPEVDCKIINADSGYSRTNYSWVLSRLLRDFDFWGYPLCRDQTLSKLEQLREQNQEKKAKAKAILSSLTASEDEKRTAQKILDRLPLPEDIHIALRVSVWKCQQPTDIPLRGSVDFVYGLGLFVTLIQLGVAAIPWGVNGEWYTFLATAAGTFLAYASASLPQWTDEKVGVRLLKKPKRTWLTVGNGAEDAILILSDVGHTDLEALAGPRRNLRAPLVNQLSVISLAILWTGFLITVAGWQQRTWYLVGVGLIGILHNVLVAGMKRRPNAWGLSFQFQHAFMEGKVMDVLTQVEDSYPGAGLAILKEFFTGDLRVHEQRYWDVAMQRYKANGQDSKAGGGGTGTKVPSMDAVIPVG